jgi:hypothetical protein
MNLVKLGMLRIRFSLLTLLLLLTFAALVAGLIGYRIESERQAAREAYRKRVISRIAWLEEERCRLDAKRYEFTVRYGSDFPTNLTVDGEIQAISDYIETSKQELDDLR